jgi:hypothetical protein
MKETPLHWHAFEYFYQLSQKMAVNGSSVAVNYCIQSVAKKFKKGERTVWRWYKDFEWETRLKERNQQIQKEIEKKINKTIVEEKADYLNIVHNILDEYQKQVIKGEIPVNIKNTMDLDRIIKLCLLIQNQPTEIHDNNIEIVKKRGLERLRRIEVEYAGKES